MTPETFIKANYKTISIKEMARLIGISYDRTRKIMIANRWQSTHARCTLVYAPLDEKLHYFNWNDFKKTDIIFSV